MFEMTRLYVCGPMTGLPELNFGSFNRATELLRLSGYEVVNPVEVNPDPSVGWLACMRQDIRELVTCDGVAWLPGCKRSRGAQIELRLAVSLGMRVWPAHMWAVEGVFSKHGGDFAKWMFNSGLDCAQVLRELR